MTIQEAALVLQASVLAQGGDVPAGYGRAEDQRPVQQMVRLSGLSLRDAKNPGGEIEIVCTGLRPGEKLSRSC